VLLFSTVPKMPAISLSVKVYGVMTSNQNTIINNFDILPCGQFGTLQSDGNTINIWYGQGEQLYGGTRAMPKGPMTTEKLLAFN